MLQPRPRRITSGAPATDMDGYRERQEQDKRTLALHTLAIMREHWHGLTNDELCSVMGVNSIRSLNSRILTAKAELGDEWDAPERVSASQARYRANRERAAAALEERRVQREQQRLKVQQEREAIDARQAQRRAVSDARRATKERKEKMAQDGTTKLRNRCLGVMEMLQAGKSHEEIARNLKILEKNVPTAISKAKKVLGNEWTIQRNRLTLEQVEEAIGPLENFKHQCHAASLALVRSGVVDGRVARGFCNRFVGGQHSWVVLGEDPYSNKLEVLDVTAWSYDDLAPKLWYAPNLQYHIPHGHGNWRESFAMPRHCGGPTIALKVPLSRQAEIFLEQFSKKGFDARGWGMVARLPVQGWPSLEIIRAILNTRQLSAMVPIDIAGMLTDRNPGNLYR